ncbi:cubilin-like, partial [Centruroides sculpturatus]|uniref:cubilin-like n=1 Tax=Centruroides sculpturatus TaxID=218467 RepID=UPI000C6D9B80
CRLPEEELRSSKTFVTLWFYLEAHRKQVPECGGKLLSPSGVFSSPGFENGTYNNNAECTWRLRNDGNVAKTLAVRFDILDIDINPNLTCLNDFVVIQDGDLTEVIGNSKRLCGNRTNEKIVVTTPSSGLLISFHTDSNRTARGFNASYSIQNCGGIIEDSESNISSPSYPNNYPPNTDCHWIFEVEHGSKIKLTFVDFQLENDCNKDFVKLINGKWWDSPTSHTLCGTNHPNEIISESNYLTVLFHSDNIGSAKGFKFLTSTVHHGCGGFIRHETSSDQGTIFSPTSETNSRYPNNIECIWILETKPDFHFLLSFPGRFDIEQNCNDYVLVEDYYNQKWNLLGRFCGLHNPADIISRSNLVRVKFHSNENNNADGFQLNHRIKCGRTFVNEETGIISSPGFPANYSDKLDCEYRIEVSPSDHISLKFDERFSIEYHQACKFDYVEISEIKSNSTLTHVGTFCGTEVPNPVSTVGSMLIHFHSDYIIVDKGFMAQFTVTSCGGILTEPSGTFEMKHAAFSNTRNFMIECVWSITVETGKVIELRFLNFQLDDNFCYEDTVFIYDGSNRDYSKLLGRYCGTEIPPIFKSTQNSLTVYFRSYEGANDKGFKAAYRTTYGPQQGCGGMLTNNEGEISSLDADNDNLYEPNLDCIWHIIQPSNNISRITFELMDIEEAHTNTTSCINDYLEIIDGVSVHDPVIGRFCGNQLPDDIVSNTNKVLVHFHSDDVENKTGFKLKYSEEQRICGGSLYVSDENRTLTTPNYPQTYPPNLHCKWLFYINASYWSHVHLTFHDFDIPCGGDRLEIREDGIDSRTLRFCGDNVLHNYVVTRNVLLYFTSDSQGGGRGFSLSYQIQGCPQNYTQPNGMIYNMGYPWRYYYPDSCNVFIHAPENYAISLYFQEFHGSYRNAPANCENLGLEVHNGSDISAPLLGIFCNRISNPVFSSSNNLLLRIRPQNPLKFVIMYTITDQGPGCGGNFTTINGTFTSPRFPGFYNKTSECRWYISVVGEHTVSLIFDVFELNSTIGCTSNYVEVYNTHDELESNKVSRYCGN